jgi:hypothetical protein
MEWESDAAKELEKIPEHVRSMAKIGIETLVEKKSKNIVTMEDVKEAAQRFMRHRLRSAIVSTSIVL